MSASVLSVPRVLLSLLLHPQRLLTIVAGTIGALLYVWVAAVRAVPGVKRRKRAAREAWRARRRRRA